MSMMTAEKAWTPQACVKGWFATQAVQEAVQQEKAAMATRLFSTLEGLRNMGLASGNGVCSSGGGHMASKPHACARGVMGTLLDVNPGSSLTPDYHILAGSQQQPLYPEPVQGGAPFSATEAVTAHDASASSLAASLSSLLSSMAVPPSGAAPGHSTLSSLANKPVRAEVEPFSFFQSGAASIWK
jgi:hypothetical protein